MCVSSALYSCKASVCASLQCGIARTRITQSPKNSPTYIIGVVDDVMQHSEEAVLFCSGTGI